MRNLYAIIIVILALALGVAAFAVKKSDSLYTPNQGEIATTTEDILGTDEVTVSIGERAVMSGGLSIEPLELIEDSRCPANANCIQMGTVRVRARVVSGLGTSTEVFELMKPITTEVESITLVSVLPQSVAGTSISPTDYDFTFVVKKRPAQNVYQTPATTIPPAQTAKCYVGGCSGQICSDTEGMVSTCEYREQYACYKTATCERQQSGQCGWTSTPTLNMCLENAS